MSAIGECMFNIQTKVESSSKRPIFDLSRKFKGCDGVRGNTVSLRDVEQILASFRIQLSDRELQMLGDCYGSPQFSYPRFVADLEMEPQQLRRLRPPTTQQPRGVIQQPNQNQNPHGQRRTREPNPATSLGGGGAYPASPPQPRQEDIERSIGRVQEWQQRNQNSRQGSRNNNNYDSNRGDNSNNDDRRRGGNNNNNYNEDRRGGNNNYNDDRRRGNNNNNYSYNDDHRGGNNSNNSYNDDDLYEEENSHRGNRNDDGGQNDCNRRPDRDNRPSARDSTPKTKIGIRGGGREGATSSSRKGGATKVGGAGINAVRAIRDTTPSKARGGKVTRGAKGKKPVKKVATNSLGMAISAPGCQVTRQDIAEGRVRQTRYDKMGALKGQATALCGVAGPTLVETKAKDGEAKRKGGRGYDIFAN